MSLCIAGVGEPMAGDDGVGVAVIDRLRELGAPAGTDLLSVRDPSDLVTALAGVDRVLIVDAVLDPDRIGHVRLVSGEEIVSPKHPLSSHGIDVLTAVELGRTLAAANFPSVSWLAVSIGLPSGRGETLSSEVADAVEGAARLALRWASEARHA